MLLPANLLASTDSQVVNRVLYCNSANWDSKSSVPTASVPASEVEAIIRFPTNMAAAKIAAADSNEMTSKWRHSTGLLACGHVRWGRSVSQSTASNASAVLIGRKKSKRIFNINLWAYLAPGWWDGSRSLQSRPRHADPRIVCTWYMAVTLSHFVRSHCLKLDA